MTAVPLINSQGLVVNVVEVSAEGVWSPPDGLVFGPEGGAIGDTWDGFAYQRPAPPPRPPVSVAEVKAEAQRRIIVLTGCEDLVSCIIKQSNANMRANELNDKRLNGDELSAADQAEAEALRALASHIKQIRSKSNEIEAISPIPNDFASDAYWA